ncbi:MAG: hypothetical protein Q9213_005454 [Squamulea squamosa]
MWGYLLKTPDVLDVDLAFTLRSSEVSGLALMQTLWARVAQPRCSCNCTSCFSSATAVSRRAATAPTRRRLGADDIFAAFFSTVAFASAVAESNRKDAKKEEWVRVIREARKDLSILKADQQRRISTLATTVPLASTPANEQLGTVDDHSWAEVFDWGEREIRDRRALGFEDWQGLPLDVLKSASKTQIRDLMKNYSHHFPRFKGSQGADVWSTVTWPYHIKKIKTLEWSIAHLALDLMSHVPDGKEWSVPNDRGIAEEVMSHLSVVTRNEIQSRRDYIQSQLNTLARRKEHDVYYHRFQSPRFPNYSVSQGNDPNAVNQLNARLHSLFENTTEHKAPKIAQLLPQICYYLLTADSPPTIHTYNLLISEFAGARRDDLICCVLRSMHRTHIRPNEITLAETLRHYVRIGDRLRFDRYVQRMEGFDEGIGEAHPQLDIPDLLKFQYRVRVSRCNSDQQSVHEYHDFSSLDKFDISELKKQVKVRIYEKPRRNLEVHQALIQGALVFHGTPEAIKHYRTMISEGWEPDQEILLSILHRCLVDLEWKAGIAVWRRLQTAGPSIDERGFVLMLQLCQKCKKHEHIQEILQTGISQRVLPPTVLEMEWHDGQMHEDVEDVVRSLGVARETSILKEDLQILLRESRASYQILQNDVHRIKFLTAQIEKSLPRPAPETLRLLREARMHTATDQQASILGLMLQDSNENVFAIARELDDIKFSIYVTVLEAQLLRKLSVFVDWLKESGSILRSMHVKRLEDRVADVEQFIVESTTSLVGINSQMIKRQLQTYREHIYNYRAEMSRYVLAYFLVFVQNIRTQTGNLSARIRVTSKEVKEITATVDGKAVRFKTRIRGEHRPRHLYDPRLPTASGTSRETHVEARVAKQPLSGSGSKDLSKADDDKLTEPVFQEAEQLHAQVQLQGESYQEAERNQIRDLRHAREPFRPNRRWKVTDVAMATRPAQGWPQPTPGLGLIHSPADSASMYELEHG